MSKNILMNNEMLMLGAGILIIGVTLISYSFSTYTEMQKLSEIIDFETVDKNNQISTSEKYYKYMEYADFLNMKLKKNSRIPLKRVACVYLDYAQHNAVEMYYLTKDKMPYDNLKTKKATDNIQDLYNTLNSYKSCKQSSEYKVILEGLLDDAIKSEKQRIEADERLDEFIYGDSKSIPQTEESPIPAPEIEPSIEQNTINNPDKVQPNYIDNEGKAQTLTPEQIEYINKQQAIHQNSAE